jgi:hypothetical protein
MEETTATTTTATTNSFFADLLENNKRRIWVWVVSWLVFALFYLIGTALVISSERNYLRGLTGYTETEKLEMMAFEVRDFLCSPGWPTFAAIVLSVLSALQGFGYLYKRRQIDFYHSKPVGKLRRFAVIWLNGILIYAIPCLASILIALIYTSAQGYGRLWLWGEALWSQLLYFALYLGLYHLCLLAVMLTGHIVFTIFMIGILQGYELLIQGLYYLMMGEFFRTYVSDGEFPLLITSPYFQVFEPNWWSLLILPLQIFGFLALAYFAYSRRQADAVGRALAFRPAEPVLKIALAVPATIVMAMVFRAATQYGGYANEGNLVFITVAAVITVVLVCCLMEVIYEFDIKAAVRRKRHILISGGVAAVIFLVFRLDIVGYDRYIPSANSLASYAVVVPGATSNNFFDETGYYMSPRDFAEQNMYATDVASILALAVSQPPRNRVNYYEFGNFGGERVYVLYRLKSGREVKRYVYVNYSNQQALSLINNIVSTKEYKKGAYIELSDYFENFWLADRGQGLFLTCSYRYGETAWPISRRDLPLFFEAYRQDIWAMNYYDVYNYAVTDSLGDIRLEIEANQSYTGGLDYARARRMSLPVHSWNVRTRAMLRELGANIYNGYDEWLWPQPQPEQYDGGL